jgi:signal transduction histidine kinase
VLTVLLYAAGWVLGPVCTAMAMVPLPAACLVAVLRFRLWDVDALLSRSLLYGGLTAVVILVYSACVGLLGGLLGRTTGAPLVATAIVAVCVEPLHRRLRALVNRLVYGEPDDPFAVLARAGRRLEGARDGASVADEVLPEVVASVAAALRLPYVAISLADGTTIEHGTRGETLAHTPLTYGGRQVGQLVYAPRAGGDDRAYRRLLDDLARHAAVAAHTVVLTRDLAQSREQLVTAREEERRRLYRELHDGLGPALAALALQVETARDLTPVDPAASRTLLDRAAPRLKSTVDEVRTLVRGLRPPALDNLGLAAALRELGDAFAAPGFTVSVHVVGVAALPAAVEVAAYRIAAEALTNAARHSGAATASLRVEQRDGRLRLAAQDDGRGCPNPADSGFGIASMRERASELGGTFTLTPADGGRGDGRGTRIEAILPVGQP